jgi:hypothetical protein
MSVTTYGFSLTTLAEIHGAAITVHSGDGLPYVLASDYDALAAENQRLETELAELKAEEPEWSAQMQRLGDDNQRLRDALQELIDRTGAVWVPPNEAACKPLREGGWTELAKDEAPQGTITTANGEVA